MNLYLEPLTVVLTKATRSSWNKKLY